MKEDYARFVELSNKGAKALGFPDAGAMWRGKYDMPPDAFAKELDRLWEQLQPLYVSLHAYMRAGCARSTAPIVPGEGPIPRTCSATCGSRTGRTSTTLVAPPGDAQVPR